MKRYIKILIISIIILFLIKIILFPAADAKTKEKIELIRQELEKSGYHPSWKIISEKRYRWYNSLLRNSSKNSYHLLGKAIDIYVFDINADHHFDRKDITILLEACRKVEKYRPDLKGAFGTYTTKGYPTDHMIHIDTRGNSMVYNY